MADKEIKETKKSTVIGTFEGKCCDSTVFNNNDMKLSRKLFEVLFASEDYKRAIKYRHYIGFLGHPNDPGCMDYRNACIVMQLTRGLPKCRNYPPENGRILLQPAGRQGLSNLHLREESLHCGRIYVNW